MDPHATEPGHPIPDGQVSVPLRIEWAEETARWDGRITIAGGEYGSQRGGIELTLVGPEDATVSLRTKEGAAYDVALADLVRQPVHPVTVPDGHLRLEPGFGGLTSLGTSSIDLTWTDPAPPRDRTAFYYARVFLADGEMAWASPIWVS